MDTRRFHEKDYELSPEGLFQALEDMEKRITAAFQSNDDSHIRMGMRVAALENNKGK
jgi:hypothetical protein